MEMTHSQSIAIDDASLVAEARRAATWFGHELGFDESEIGNVALVVTELSTNIIKHARNGTIVLQTAQAPLDSGLEIFALDNGPGMASTRDALRDGYSTGGSSGTGLGAVQRLSDTFEIYTYPGLGTVVRVEIWKKGQERRFSTSPSVGVLCVPIISEVVCGDNWCIQHSNERDFTVLVVDGLGHGEHAATAADTAVEIFRSTHFDSPDITLRQMHEGLRHTRGAVGAVAHGSAVDSKLTFAGVGNISGRIVGREGSRRTMSHNGTLGLAFQHNATLTYDWPEYSLLILHSDGIVNRWNLNQYPGLFDASPGLIAGVLFRDFRRERDDSTVLVVRRDTP